MDPELLAYWKKEHGEAYRLDLGDKPYYFRALTLEEIDDIALIVGDEGTSADAEDYYVKAGVLWPQEFAINSIKPGYVSQLAQSIMQVSGMLSIEAVLQSLEEQRDSITGDIIDMMKAFIITAMPLYTDEQLSQFNIKQLIRKVVLAEKIFSLNQTINGIPSDGVVFRIYSADEEEYEEEAPQQRPRRSKSKQDKIDLVRERMATEDRKRVDKEELLRRIRSEDAATISPFADGQMRFDQRAQEALDNVDEDLLLTMAGNIKPHDPIAEKLRRAMGG